jgi:hypothetical protein
VSNEPITKLAFADDNAVAVQPNKLQGHRPCLSPERAILCNGSPLTSAECAGRSSDRSTGEGRRFTQVRGRNGRCQHAELNELPVSGAALFPLRDLTGPFSKAEGLFTVLIGIPC